MQRCCGTIKWWGLSKVRIVLRRYARRIRDKSKLVDSTSLARTVQGRPSENSSDALSMDLRTTRWSLPPTYSTPSERTVSHLDNSSSTPNISLWFPHSTSRVDSRSEKSHQMACTEFLTGRMLPCHTKKPAQISTTNSMPFSQVPNPSNTI